MRRLERRGATYGVFAAPSEEGARRAPLCVTQAASRARPPAVRGSSLDLRSTGVGDGSSIPARGCRGGTRRALRLTARHPPRLADVPVAHVARNFALRQVDYRRRGTVGAVSQEVQRQSAKSRDPHAPWQLVLVRAAGTGLVACKLSTDRRRHSGHADRRGADAGVSGPRRGGAHSRRPSGFLGDVVLTTPLIAGLRRRRRRPNRCSLHRRRPFGAPPRLDAVVVDDSGATARGGRPLAARGGAAPPSFHRRGRGVQVGADGARRAPRASASRRVRERPRARLYTERVRGLVTRHDRDRLLELRGRSAHEDEPRAPWVPTRRRRKAMLARRGDRPSARGDLSGGGLAHSAVAEAYGARARPDAGVRVRALGRPTSEGSRRRSAAAEGAGSTSRAPPTWASRRQCWRAQPSWSRTTARPCVAPRRPQVAIFCATVPAQGYGPLGIRAVVVEKDLGAARVDGTAAAVRAEPTIAYARRGRRGARRSSASSRREPARMRALALAIYRSTVFADRPAPATIPGASRYLPRVPTGGAAGRGRAADDGGRCARCAGPHPSCRAPRSSSCCAPRKASAVPARPRRSA